MSDNPNILIIWGDDIGQSNLSCFTDGVMGYRTRNIDRIAAEGATVTVDDPVSLRIDLPALLEP